MSDHIPYEKPMSSHVMNCNVFAPVLQVQDSHLQLANADGGPPQSISNDVKDGCKASRRLLASAEAIPSSLSTRWTIPEGVMIYHTTHVDSTLPLFQARLQNGSYDGK